MRKHNESVDRGMAAVTEIVRLLQPFEAAERKKIVATVMLFLRGRKKDGLVRSAGQAGRRVVVKETPLPGCTITVKELFPESDETCLPCPPAGGMTGRESEI